MMQTATWTLAAILTAGIIHIGSIFAIPSLARMDAWSRVTATLKQNTLTVTPSPAASPLPFTSPDIIEAYCPFDISERNLVITSPLPEPAWSIAVSVKSGENFYLITGADAKATAARILVIPRNRLAQEASNELSDEGDEQTIIVSKEAQGVAVIRAPLRGESFRQRTLETIKQAKCELQKPFDTAPVIAALRPSDAAAGAKPSASRTPASSTDRRPRRRRN